MKTRRMIGAGAATAALLLAGAVATPAFAADQTVTDLNDASLTAESLVESLLGDDTEVSNVTFTGDPRGAGVASGFEDVFGIDGGVVLASGAVAGSSSIILGPNTSDGTSVSLGAPGDTDLDAIVAPNSTRDASVLEFDFVPQSSTITFSYVFGSDEYQEYVDSSFNDVFGFFVNGTNYATVNTADGVVPVAINSINHKTNSSFYVDNYGENNTNFNTELDGFTVVLTFEAPVNAGEVNHIKLAIADTSDRSRDSAVLIAAGSFKSNTAPVANDVAKETEFDTPVDVTLDGTDADGDALTYEIVDAPAAEQGTVSAVDGNKVTFTPAEGFTGDATFTYRVNDGSVNSAPATVTVTVLEEGTVIPTPTPTPTPTETTTAPTTTPPTTDPATSVPTATDSESPKPDKGDKPAKGDQDDDALASTGASDMGLLIGLSAALMLAGGLAFAANKRRRA
ncbi:MAG: choice-of-anchor L domain-containing protein [Gulosibacter sp.]|uniref:choice-of-anchor L domain-containing protein n=1 Tax=Gulosibacter sp. TaxID=2817531 RepID=UPI003F91695F